MTMIAPFRGTHFNTQMFKDLTDLIIPPYDNIPAGEEKRYMAKSPYNFAHVLVPRSDDSEYQKSNQILNQWRDAKTLVEDPSPGFYVYGQEFSVDGVTYHRNTLMCLVKVHEFSDGIVRPHENTYGKYKADRLKILQATQTNLSHVFAMVHDPEGFLASRYEKWCFETPLLKGRSDEGVNHSVWRVEASKANDVVDFFKTRPIYIVDGHHRYEVSVQYAKQLGVLGKTDHPAAYMLFAIANSFDPALIVFPTHRFVHGVSASQISMENIEREFTLAPTTIEEIQKFVKKPVATPQFGLFVKGNPYHCVPKNWQAEQAKLGDSVGKLSVVWSDRKLLANHFGVTDDNRGEKIKYDKDPMALWNQRSEASAIVFHAPPAIADIAAVSDEKGFMPQKSTFFYPKLGAGLILRKI